MARVPVRGNRDPAPIYLHRFTFNPRTLRVSVFYRRWPQRFDTFCRVTERRNDPLRFLAVGRVCKRTGVTLRQLTRL